MRKGIKLTLTLWIEGEDEPAHHWAEYTMQAMREIIAAGSEKYPGLQITIRKLLEDRNYDEEEAAPSPPRSN